MIDVFGTAAIRNRVLAGWTASPARFREDANAEEELVHGGHRDRLVVELAQNAADAAARAAAPGRVRFSLDDIAGRPTLVVANTGTPLTAAGVEALATLRASAKRGGESGVVGRFGVGFAAVLAVTDEPLIVSSAGGVRFSRAETAAMVAEAGRDAPELGAEVRRRGGHVPVLRLPFAVEAEPAGGYDTEVVLPLRDDAAADLVRRLLDEAGDALLLALPSLERIEICVDGSERVLADAPDRWHVQRRYGEFSADEREQLLADRPTEERARPYWSVLWAMPRDPSVGLPGTVYAPTPTDEPLSLRALLLASFPLDPTRRHVAAGPLTDRLVAEAGRTYAELARSRAEDGADVLTLVPTGLAAGALDASLRAAVLAALPATAILRAVEDGRLLRPNDAVVVEDADDAFTAVLAPIVDGLVAASGSDRVALDALGVRRLDLAGVVDQLASMGGSRPPGWWRDLYAALAGMVVDPLTREALGTLPVPLADGRVVRGPRGLLLPGAELPAETGETLAPYGLRLVHPDAVHETLERLGAAQASARALLADGAVRTAVEHSADADDPDAIAEAVLTIVDSALADTAPLGNPAWLGELALRDSDGELVPASMLVVPGSDAEQVLDPAEVAPVDPGLIERYGPAVLEAVGVAQTLGVVSASDVALDALPVELEDVDDLAGWAADVAAPGAIAGEVVAVRDLDVIAEGAWPRVLGLLGSEPALRSALVKPVRVIAADGQAEDVVSYAAWWIRRHVHLDERALAGRADPDADPVLVELLDEAPDWLAGLDRDVRTAIGLVRQVGELDEHGIERLLRRLADPGRDLETAAALRLWTELGSFGEYPREAPAQVRVLAEDGTRVLDADDAVVVDAPMWLQRTDLGGYVVASGSAADGLSEVLDLPLVGEVATGRIDGEGAPAPVPPFVRRLVPEVPATWWEHEELTVDGEEVSWWVPDDGSAHAATVEGLAKALAWSAGRWAQRHLILAALTEPERAAELLLDTTFDSAPTDRAR